VNTNTTTRGTETAESTAQTPTIELVAVTKRFEETTALDNITLSIADGEFVVLLGPSGCGKSTILRLISGLEDVTEGEIYINGNLANYTVPKERDVSMVFQNYALYPHMTVERNIGFPLEMAGVPKTERLKQAAEVARLLEIEDQFGKYPEQLSGGQRQRVALGRALIRDPIAYLLDEPLSNLDAILRVQMRDELLKLHRRIGRTTLYVTHDQVEAMTMADRIVILKAGIIQQVGEPREIYMRPANTFVATFVGSPQMSLFEGALVGSNGELKFSGPFTMRLGDRFASLEAGADVFLGIRPEDPAVVDEGVSEQVSGRVALVEPIGSDTYLNVELAQDASLKVRVPAFAHFQEGDSIHLRITPENVHLFDADGQRVVAEQER
jgi:multiple sugar transport system ATP-binding protein